MSKENFDKEKNYSYVEAVDEEIITPRTDEERLLAAMGGVDDKYIEEAKPKISRRIKVFKIASCVACIIAVVLAGIGVSGIIKNSPTEDAKVEEVKTARFETLDELLEHLGISKEDKGRGGDKIYYPGIIRQNSGNDSKTAETYGGYIYRVCNEKLQIISEKNIQGDEVYTLEGNVNDVAIVKDKLIVLDGYVVENGRETLNKNTIYKVYDLKIPYEPKLINTYVFNAHGTYIHIRNDEIVFEMRDGACGCGYGNGYYAPEVTIDDELITWSDKEICVLGNPSVIQYAAFGRIDIETGKIVEKQAYYGMIENIYLGEECLAIETKSMDGIQEMYAYKIDHLSTNLGGFDIVSTAKQTGECEDFEIKSISMENNILYAVGISKELDNKENTQISALLWDVQSKRIIWENISIGKDGRIDSVTWSEKKAICNMNNVTDDSKEAKVYVEFYDDEIKMTKGVMVTNDEESYYGYYTLSETIYARRNSEENNVIAIFECLDSGDVENVYQTRIEDDVKIEIIDVVPLKNNIIGIITSKKDLAPNENDEYNTVVELRQYRLVTEGGVSLEFLSSSEIRKGYRAYRENYRIYEKEGKQYLIFDRSEEIIPVDL